MLYLERFLIFLLDSFWTCGKLLFAAEESFVWCQAAWLILEDQPRRRKQQLQWNLTTNLELNLLSRKLESLFGDILHSHPFPSRPSNRKWTKEPRKNKSIFQVTADAIPGNLKVINTATEAESSKNRAKLIKIIWNWKINRADWDRESSCGLWLLVSLFWFWFVAHSCTSEWK